MVLVIDLLVRAHEIDRSSVLENSSIAVIPLAVKLYEIPVMVAARYGISLDHHVGNARKIQEHLGACIVNVTVARTPGESPVASLCIRRSSWNVCIVNMAVNPVEDISCCGNVILAPEA